MLGRLVDKMRKEFQTLQSKYELSQRRLIEHISMRPKDMVWRSVKTANYSTLLVIMICYPILLYYRGLDYDLQRGMLLHYSVFWFVIFVMVTSIQFIWLIGYCITQRFCENVLDFEILDRIFGCDCDAEMSDMEELENAPDGLKRAKG